MSLKCEKKKCNSKELEIRIVEYTVMMISVSSNDDDKFNGASYLRVFSASLNFATGLVIAALFCI